MIKVRISNNRVSEDVISNRDYISEYTYPSLGIKKGDSIKLFYINNKFFYTFEKMNYYNKPYSPRDKYEVLVKKNPVLDKLIKEYDLIFTV